MLPEPDLFSGARHTLPRHTSPRRDAESGRESLSGCGSPCGRVHSRCGSLDLDHETNLSHDYSFNTVATLTLPSRKTFRLGPPHARDLGLYNPFRRRGREGGEGRREGEREEGGGRVSRRWYLIVIVLLYIGLLTSFSLNVSLLMRRSSSLLRDKEQLAGGNSPTEADDLQGES